MTDYADLTAFIVRSIASRPDEVAVSSRPAGRQLIVTVTAAPDDMGKLIGKNGRNIDAIRTVVRVAGLRNHQRVQVDLG